MSKVGEGKSSDPGSTNGKRQRSRDSEEPTEVWTEHVSSSGRTYFYNKRCDKSQWERPDGPIKKSVGYKLEWAGTHPQIICSAFLVKLVAVAQSYWLYYLGVHKC